MYKHEVDLVKSDLKNDTELKEQQIKVLQETIRNLQTQLLENKSKEKESEQKLKGLEDKLKSANVKELLLKTKIATWHNNKKSGGSGGSGDVSNDELQSEDGGGGRILNVKCERMDEDEAKVISIVSAFLVVHPFGASISYIWSYLNQFVQSVSAKALEEILMRYAHLFVEDVSGVGAKIEKKWKYTGFGQDYSTY